MTGGKPEDGYAIRARIGEIEQELATPELDAVWAALEDAETAFRRAQVSGSDDLGPLWEAFHQAVDEWNRTSRAFDDGRTVDETRALEAELRVLRVTHAQLTGGLYQDELVFSPGEIEGCPFDDELLIQPDLSGSGEFFMQTEFGPPFVGFGATAVNPIDRRERLGALGGVAAAFEAGGALPLWATTQAQFGYPNEDPAPKVFGPGFHGIGLYEVFNSGWPKRIAKENQYTFPWTPDDLALSHYRFAFKENTLEVLAAGITVWSGLASRNEAIELYQSLPGSGPFD